MSEDKATYNTKAQTIFRVAKNPDNPFVMMDRRPLERETISWGAKGLLAYLLSRPDDWVIRFKDLVKRSTDGGHKVRGFMKELRGAGHVQIISHRDGGRITEWEYKVFEVPPDHEFQQVEIPDVVNRTFNNNKRPLTKKKVKEGATPRTPKEPKPALAKEITLYREVTKKYPPSPNYGDVETKITAVAARLGRGVTVADLRPFYTAWTANGWNQFSINWLDYAVRGEMPTTFKQKAQQVQSKTKTAIEGFLSTFIPQEDEVIDGVTD